MTSQRRQPPDRGIPLERLLERFCRYVRINTQADEKATVYPSSPGQLELGRLLLGELRDLGLRDAVMDRHGIIMATVPGNLAAYPPVVAWIAHLDTSPETSGANVQPIVHRSYDGRDIVLPGNPSQVLRPLDNPELAACVGKTIITTDGTTLLGADDKAGVAVIVEAAAYLMAHPEVPRGPIRICFTCDEEIGRGVDHLDLRQLGADVAYTLDGRGVGEIDTETFSADLAIVTLHGVNIHPSIAKGRMVNALRLAGNFIRRLPPELSPERTADREGFLHPYRIEGGVAEVTLRILLRDFETARLAEQAQLLRDIARTVETEEPGGRIDIQVTPQYRNLAEGLAKEPRAVALAEEAMRRAGVTPRRTSVRGGTDGSRLTELGLPTPNLSTGEHNLHSPLEWTCLEEMATAVHVLVELARLWSAESAAPPADAAARADSPSVG
ncbi:MAG: peptidase T [Gemmataceae bacterium]|nr:peptidase T [Gemmataceae bacterium]MDW8267137.1 peptidase T [Gemmataceae bacterium]